MPRLENITAEDAAVEEARQIIFERGADAGLLYRHWFHHEIDETCHWPSAAAYRAAGLDADRLEAGWQVARSFAGAAGAVVAVRDGRERVVAPPEMVPADARCLMPVAGTALLLDPLAYGETNGFWHVWSPGWQSAAPERLQRFYVNVALPLALDFVIKFLADMPAGSTWAMKILCGTHKRGRRDGALVYLPADMDADAFWTPRLVRLAKACCEADLPPFVTPVAPGLGWAPDPGGGKSFGEALCGAILSAAPQSADASAFRVAARRAVQSLLAACSEFAGGEKP